MVHKNLINWLILIACLFTLVFCQGCAAAQVSNPFSSGGTDLGNANGMGLVLILGALVWQGGKALAEHDWSDDEDQGPSAEIIEWDYADAWEEVLNGLNS
jgi:hypothetical protein